MLHEGDEALFDNTPEGKGDEIQKLSVIQTLSNLLADDQQSCIARLIPKIQQTLPNASVDFHLSASSTFKTILNQKLVNHSTFTSTFLQIILSSLDSKEPVIALAWLETLLDVIELLPPDVLRREILPLSINKGHLSQSVSSRIMSSKLIGKICTRFDSQLIKKEVLPTVHSLCQDISKDVRAAICSQLCFIAEKLGAESVKSTLLSSIVELASDEETNVRHAAIQTIVYLLPHLQNDVLKTTISPLIKKCCDNAFKSEDRVLCIISKEFGKLSLGLDKCLNNKNDKLWIINYYKQLSQLGVAPNKDNIRPEFLLSNTLQLQELYIECRQNCAYNLPAMFLFASKTDDNINSIIPILENLINDTNENIRRIVACGIYEIIKITGTKNNIIKNNILKLLKDDNENVLSGIVPYISKILQLYFPTQTIQTVQVMDFGTALLKCENLIFNTKNWRLSTNLFEQLEILPKCFPSDYIYSTFIPMIFDRALNARPIPIKLSAGKTLLVLIRYNIKQQQITELHGKLITEFAQNNNSYIRIQFLRIVDIATSIFSTYYIKQHFFTIIMNLTEDPIANVRLKAVTLLPMLKLCIRLPTDKKLLLSFEACVRNIMNNETDRDVKFTLTKIIRKIDEIETIHESQIPSVKPNKQEIENFKKYEEEKNLLAAMSGKVITVGVPAIPAIPTTSISPKKIAPNGRTNEASSSKSTKPSIQGLETSSKISYPTVPKSRQATIPVLSSENSSKISKVGGSNKSFDSAQASTSSNNLTSSWAQLTSNSMLLTHLWETIDQPDTNNFSKSLDNIDYQSSNNYLSELSCDCYDSSSFVYPPRSTLTTSSNSNYNKCDENCACRNITTKFNQYLHKDNYFDTSLLTNPLKLTNNHNYKSDYFNKLLLHRDSSLNVCKTPNLPALRALTNAAHYNSCWAFSSMPEIPVNLFNDEFPINTDIRIPTQISSPRRASKIPNINDVLSRNTRIEYDKNKRSSVNLDKSKFTTTGKINRLSMNLDEQRYRTRSYSDDLGFAKDDLKTKRFNFQRGKSTEGPPKSTFSMTQKVRQTTMPILSSESSSKTSTKQPGTSRKFDMSKASSMPEIPVDMYANEYPQQLKIIEQPSIQQRASKIPNINDVISRNSRADTDKNKRISLNLERGKTLVGKNRLSMIPGQRTTKIPSIKDMLC
ncbi:serine/threonine-protein phosphatase 4 regulatory subunit 4-like isoform X2 [Aphidius gifuensis]|uniref:serine/threonine-protein phosphatase 4 regulatory subunit 4-like isoform X2 n=1 Tax=Aphidius gifuensis TaxID=684658 RepID=UPI001CDBB332|nr:serine/threonine-protein phosphatase 4 regulatory subunit 4-like isoform X2 [Aphidius gifuensis]